MALIRKVGMSGLVSALQEAFTFAGGTLGTLTVESGTTPTENKTGALIKNGTATIAYAWITEGDYGAVLFGACSSAGNNFYVYTPYAQKNALRVIATRTAVAVTNYDANNVSQYALVITTDSNGDLCCLVETAENVGLKNPTVVPVDAEYTMEVKYPAETSTSFGSTALAKIPVPTFNGNARWLPYVFFAHATQYQEDGSVLLNSLSRFYNIGGSWFLDDGEVST